MTATDGLEQLRSAGFALDGATADQQAVLRELTADEIGVLSSIKARFDAAAPEIEGHMRDGGVIF